MNTINRSAVIIKPKRAYIKWANSCSPDGCEYSTEYFVEHSIVLLIPASTIIAEAREYVSMMWEDIFTEALHQWNPDETLWPKNRTRKIFWQWFDLEFYSEVIDPAGDGKIAF